MQVKVQTVNELTINQLSEDQYKAEKAAGRINAGEVYACTPSPVKWEDIQNKPDVSSGGDVDFQELARRIPTWQWKVTMPQTAGQTVTATVGEQTYTSDFYAQQGSNVTFSVKADDGYQAGTLSLESATLTEDMTVTVTGAVTNENKVVAGKFEAYFYPADGIMPKPLVVPDRVNVVKVYCSKDYPVYAKVSEGMVIEFSEGTRVYRRKTHDIFKAAPKGIDSFIFAYKRAVSASIWMYFEWSQEINEHTVDIDLTQAGQSRAV